MKRIVLFSTLLLAACTGGSDDAPAPTGTDGAGAAASGDAAAATMTTGEDARTSHYTALKDCTVIDSRADEDWSVSRCEGPDGYTLYIDYGDARDDLRVQRAGAEPVAVGLIALGGGGFNTLGNTVEWRGSGAGDAFVPSALIVRNSLVENPERPDRPTGILVVIDPVRGCAVAQVRPQSGQNEAARAIADGPRRPCLGRES
ncbi:MAG: hypothetical protein GXC70_01360 [Sphingomonadaceae bacterium]|nr:hypothetical protein [Sphingomonadaceae bacterium]